MAGIGSTDQFLKAQTDHQVLLRLSRMLMKLNFRREVAHQIRALVSNLNLIGSIKEVIMKK